MKSSEPDDYLIPRFSAVFDDGDGELSCGAFDTAQEAEEFGAKMAGPHLDFVEVQRRLAMKTLYSHINTLTAQHTTFLDGEGSRRGTIVRWQPYDNWGFISDTEGNQWYVREDQVLPDRECLDVRTPVTFSGSPHPKPGKRWPEAYSVRVAEVAPPEPAAPGEPEPVPAEPEIEPPPDPQPADPEPAAPDLLARIVDSMRGLADLLDAARTQARFAELLDESALGSPNSKAIQSLTPPHVAAELAERVDAALQRPVPGPPPRKDPS